MINLLTEETKEEAAPNKNIDREGKGAKQICFSLI
jgi:hypothetical protein